MINRKTVLFILIMTNIWSCAALQRVIQKPTLKFTGVSLKSISLFEATSVFTFKVTNPNSMDMTIEKVAYNLKIRDKKFAEGVLDKQVTLKSGSSEIVDIPITINYMDVFESAIELIKTDKVDYNLSGSVSVGPFTVPYQEKGYFDVPKVKIPFL